MAAAGGAAVAALRPRLAALRARLARDVATPEPIPAAAVVAAPAPLRDSFGRVHTYLRVSLAERCNLRCVYCMPEGGVALTPAAQLLTTEELVATVALFARHGVDKVRLTGGEPTLRRDLVDIVARLRATAGIRTVAMTTNAVALPRAKLLRLRDAGLSRINISLDSWRPATFAAMSRRPAETHGRVVDTLHAALDAGFDRVKVNVVVLAGQNDGELPDFVAFTRDHPIDVRFIELMPFAGNAWTAGAVVPMAEQLRRIVAAFPTAAPEASASGETAEMWKVPGHVGRFGFIPTMTHAFCGTCNRLRLTADGNLKACLHGDEEVPLRDLVRSGRWAEVEAAIRRALVGKHAALGGHRTETAFADAWAGGEQRGSVDRPRVNRRPMITIGG